MSFVSALAVPSGRRESGICETRETSNSDETRHESVDSTSSLEDDRLKKLPAVLEKQRVEVICSDAPEVVNKSMVFYEQMQYNDRWYQLGDFVYVYNPLKNRNAIL
ncbi:unnamed protein product, partial [Wuchereria bancrofti]